MKDIWKFKDVGKRNEICYTPESIRHPAKMELNMCREIIKKYSKKGDTILDPMAGIGTTIIEGMLLGRNVIGIEYEQKFVDMAKENIERTNKNCSYFKSLGTGTIIKGDSRQLSDLLNKSVDRIMMSPPFANLNQGAGLNKRKHEGKLTKDDIRMGNCIHKFSDDKNNIDNIKDYGKVDSIVTSPPYAHESVTTRSDKKRTDKWSKELSLLKQDNYSDDPNNLGNATGKTYLSEMLKIYKECFTVLHKEGIMVLVTKNFVRKAEQIRLDLDTISLCEQSGFKYLTRHYRKITNPSFWITNAIQKWEKKNPDKDHPYPLEEDILVFRRAQ